MKTIYWYNFVCFYSFKTNFVRLFALGTIHGGQTFSLLKYIFIFAFYVFAHELRFSGIQNTKLLWKFLHQGFKSCSKFFNKIYRNPLNRFNMSISVSEYEQSLKSRPKTYRTPHSTMKLMTQMTRIGPFPFTTIPFEASTFPFIYHSLREVKIVGFRLNHVYFSISSSASQCICTLNLQKWECGLRFNIDKNLWIHLCNGRPLKTENRCPFPIHCERT